MIASVYEAKFLLTISHKLVVSHQQVFAFPRLRCQWTAYNDVLRGARGQENNRAVPQSSIAYLRRTIPSTYRRTEDKHTICILFQSQENPNQDDATLRAYSMISTLICMLSMHSALKDLDDYLCILEGAHP
jgi:hypothetical protein